MNVTNLIQNNAGKTSAQCTWTCVKSCWQIKRVCFNLLCVADGWVSFTGSGRGACLWRKVSTVLEAVTSVTFVKTDSNLNVRCVIVILRQFYSAGIMIR